jgi:hypothetical protein
MVQLSACHVSFTSVTPLPPRIEPRPPSLKGKRGDHGTTSAGSMVLRFSPGGARTLDQQDMDLIARTSKENGVGLKYSYPV